MSKWYTNVYFLTVFFLSATAAVMACLALLLLPQSPEIIRIMQWRMVRAGSFSFDVGVHYDGQTTVGEPADETVVFSSHGTFDRTGREARIRQYFDLVAGTAPNASEYRGQLDQSGKDSFIRFNGLPDRLGALRLEPLLNLDFRLDLPRIRSRFDSPFLGSGRELTEADEAHLVDQLKLIPFFVFEGRQPDDSLAGVSVHRYTVKPEKLFFKDFVVQYETTRLGRGLTGTEQEALDDFFARLTADRGEMWIGKGDCYLYRMRLRFHYADDRRKGTVDLNVDFRDFNKPVALQGVPSQAEDISTFIESLMPSLSEHLPLAKEGPVPRVQPTAQPAVPTANPRSTGDSDNDGLPDDLEHFYMTDPHNPDTDGDGTTDGYEVDHGTDPNGSGPLFGFGLGGIKR